MKTSVRIASEEMPDGVLIRQASEGNEEAFEILVRRYREGLFRLIYNSLGNYHTTYDVLQQYVSRALSELHTEGSISSNGIYLVTIAMMRKPPPKRFDAGAGGTFFGPGESGGV